MPWTIFSRTRPTLKWHLCSEEGCRRKRGKWENTLGPNPTATGEDCGFQGGSLPELPPPSKRLSTVSWPELSPQYRQGVSISKFLFHQPLKCCAALCLQPPRRGGWGESGTPRTPPNHPGRSHLPALYSVDFTQRLSADTKHKWKLVGTQNEIRPWTIEFKAFDSIEIAFS